MTPPEKLTEVERKCRAAIAAREAEGLRVVPLRLAGVAGDVWCPLDCLAGHNRRMTRGEDFRSQAAENAGISVAEAEALEGGFEDWDWYEEESPEFYSIGQTLRAEQMRKHGGAQ